MYEDRLQLLSSVVFANDAKPVWQTIAQNGE